MLALDKTTGYEDEESRNDNEGGVESDAAAKV
jgi:hypothetical protein